MSGFIYHVLILSIVVILPSWAHSQANPGQKFSIALHGGAGLEPEKLSDSDREAHNKALKAAIVVGQKVLVDGGTAMDAVEQTIRVLEDEPLYNAGHGAVFNNVGKHELDASIMDGQTRLAGAVAGLTTVKNPISLARLVMTQTNHVLLIGEGAEKFADEMRAQPGIERVPNSYFSTAHRRKEWEETVERERQASGKQSGKGTVGCVARDIHGNLAAGTSTGGLTNKKWGRAGAVPIVGAGTFADNETLAVSCTGIGEHFIRNSVAFQLHALIKFRGARLEQAVTDVLREVLPNDTGGVIAVNTHGEIVMDCNTPGMARASYKSGGEIEIFLEAPKH